MMYGDAPYADRPYSDIENLVGFADGQLEATATFQYVIYAATRLFAANFDDSIAPNRVFRGSLQSPLSFRRSILGSELGTFSTGDGTTIIDNTDGHYDNLPETFTADGRPCEIKVMKKGEDLSQAFTLFKGVMASWFIDETQVAIQLRDYGYKLNVPVQPSIYAGTGEAEGGEDVAGKRKPLGVGSPANVAAVLLSSQFLVYQVHDGEVDDVTAVYDRGAALTKGADYPDWAALVAATVAGGSYATCVALGLFRLGTNAAGQVTADYATGVDTTADAVEFLVENATDLTYEADFFAPAFERMNTVQPAEIDYWLGPESSVTVADACANLARGVGGWCGFRRDGLFEIRRLEAPAGDPITTFRRIDIMNIRREPLPGALTPPPWRYRLMYGRNWTVQTDLAGSVSAARKSFAEAEFRLAEASAESIRTDHPFAQDPEPRQTYFRIAGPAQDEATRLLNRDRVERALYRTDLPRKALYNELGDEVELIYPRWDLSVGRDLIFVEMDYAIQGGGQQIDMVQAVLYG